MSSEHQRSRVALGQLLSVVLLGSLMTVVSPAVSAVATPDQTQEVSTAQSVSYTPSVPADGRTYPGGPGHSGNFHVGTWKYGKYCGVCYDFNLRGAGGDGLKKFDGSLPGLSRENSEKAGFLVNKYCKPNQSSIRAQALQWSIWFLRGDKDVQKYWKHGRKTKVIGDALDREVARMLNEAAGSRTYKMSISLNPVHVGDTGVGTVTLQNGSGQAVNGETVRLRISGGKLLGDSSNKGITKSNGTLSFRYTPVDTTPVHVGAVAKVPSTKAVGLSDARKGSQRTLIGGNLNEIVATASALKTAAVSIKSTCTTNCDGNSTITSSYCNPSGTDAIKFVSIKDGKEFPTLNLPGGKCGTNSYTAFDASIISGWYCYTGKNVGGDCKTKKVAITPFEVLCPPWLLWEYTQSGGCNNQSPLTIKLSAPSQSRRFYIGQVTTTNKAGQSVAQHVKLTGGQSGTVQAPTTSDVSHVTIAFIAYRDAQHTLPLSSLHVLKQIPLIASECSA